MDLGELIKAHRADLSYERLAKRAADAGHEISGTMLHWFGTKEVQNIPRVETLHAIAAALRVSPKEVLDAAAESVGLTPSPPDEDQANRAQVQAIVSLLRHRPDPELEHLGRLLGDLVQVLDSGRSETHA